jgi:hypothetical protein
VPPDRFEADVADPAVAHAGTPPEVIVKTVPEDPAGMNEVAFAAD